MKKASIPEDITVAESRVARNQKQSQTFDDKKPHNPHLYSSQEHLDKKGFNTAGRYPESLLPN